MRAGIRKGIRDVDTQQGGGTMHEGSLFPAVSAACTLAAF